VTSDLSAVLRAAADGPGLDQRSLHLAVTAIRRAAGQDR
jgi:hypothetical protein